MSTPVRRGQRVYREHAKGGHAVNKDVVIPALQPFQNLSKHCFPAHGIDQQHFHAGKCDVGGQKVNALRVADDALAGMNGRILEYAAHKLGERNGQLVRLRRSQADGQAGLRVAVHEQHLLPFARQPDAKAGTGRRLANASLLIGDGGNGRAHRFTSQTTKQRHP